MDDGLMKDEATATTTTRGGATLWVAARRWWRQLSPTMTRRILAASMVLINLILMGLTVTMHTLRSQRRHCLEYGQQVGSNVRNDDSFALSVARYHWGFFYSYRLGSTGATEGPRILLLQDIWYTALIEFEYNGRYAAMFPYTVVYEFELSIGKDANGNVVWFSSEDDADGDVEIDPSVVHLSFSNGATFNVYNDSVFLISYRYTGNELLIVQRAIDLSGISTECGMKHLFQRNADLAAFDAQWRSGATYSLPDNEYYSKENDPN
jgi:hypothetical protein